MSSRNEAGPAAALAEIAGRWSLARIDGGRASVEGLARGDAEGLARILASWGTARLVRIAPAGATIAKLVPAPVGTDDAVEASIRLLGEGELPASIPGHRRAGDVVEGGAARHALLIGWLPGEAPRELVKGVEERWTTFPAVLAALHDGTPGFSLWAEDDGAIVAFATGELGTRLRVVREDRADQAAWAARLAAAAAEAARFAGLAEPGPVRTPLHVDAGVLARVASRLGLEERDAADHALALGAASLAGSPLAALSAAPPRDEAPAIVRTARWLSRPRNAWLAGAACVAFVMLAPLGFAQARLSLLGTKAGDLDQSSEKEIRKQAALYGQVAQTRWPMTKLLADVAAATPVGVTVESLRLSTDQGLAIQGTAESIELVNRLQQNLNRTGLFASVRRDRVEASESGVAFDVGAAVTQPYRAVSEAEDFIAAPLAVRLYGEEARDKPNMPLVAGDSARPRAGSSSPSRTERAERAEPSEGERRTVGSSEARSSPSTASAEVPPPLTDAQIAAMDENTARGEWVTRRTFPQRNPELDQATKDRLADDARRLQEHRSKLRASGGNP